MSHSNDFSPPPRWATWLVWAMILAFTACFSLLAVDLHAAHRTHKSDLGQMDQAIWNTSQGRFVEESRESGLATRLTDHVEPIFFAVSLLFLVWDDVRALLVLQALALALGAWPLFLIAWRRFGGLTPGDLAAGRIRLRSSTLPAVVALVFAAAFLLHPSLQAPITAEFHAMPLATPLIAFALLFSERSQWGRFLLMACLVALVQEGAALLTATLGLYVLGRAVWLRLRNNLVVRPTRRMVLAGALALLAGLGWFYVATFVIIPAHASAAYGVSESPYVARFGALGSSFGDVLKTLITRPLRVLEVAAEPLRLAYWPKLLAPAGFFALAAPELLLVGLPLLLANLLSAYPLQYSGQLHYSAPLVPLVVAATIVGSQRLNRALRRMAAALHSRPLWRLCRSFAVLIVWLGASALLAQITWGYTPIGSQYQFARTTPSAHTALLARFSAQIPADAPLSATPTLYPHFSHRRYIYQFPVVANSDYVLLDAAADNSWAAHPVVLRDQAAALLASGQWHVLDAADGYLLMQRQAGSPAVTLADLPTEFFSFARATAAPQHPLDLLFSGPDGAQLKLVGYDLLPDNQWRGTAFRFYWQALTPLPAEATPRVFFITPDGQTADNSDERPLIQPLWLPPQRWQPGEVIVTDKLTWYLPKTWAIGAGVYQGGPWGDVQYRWHVLVADQATQPFDYATWTTLGAWQWRNNRIEPLQPPVFSDLQQTFAGDGWQVRLTGINEPVRSAPGARVPVLLRWQADGPAPRDLSVFLHVRDAQGNVVAQGDAMPTWFGILPTTQWPAAQPVLAAHAVTLPATLKPGVYEVWIGWYYWETLERLALLDAAGQAVSNGFVAGRIEVDATLAARADLPCALIPEACASQ
ncbi:MAG: DUF2079 domain-containing protein [Caldilineales bacterium]